ncbi:hypothetical protein AVE30378_03090 [Achromobacter veterisilvae]|uniref:Uncharacterized protein n=1 Tax=Achromobacter veterisilvae TaxID=2069367 RepID=A0A446CLG3_9BURK|nr:hypothetical protein [Achromobacter veterisilvae]SSW68631.1 hypothetical protein AVE30378_03090 [Achromobacter veterisilvae]
MSILKSVKIVSADRKAVPSPTFSKRHRLLVRIDELLALAEASRDGKNFRPEHTRTYVDPATGNKEQRLVEKRLQKWWWVASNAKVYVELRYGSRPIELTPGKTAIELDSESQVIDTLALLKQAVLAGELDKQLAAAGMTWRAALRPKT